MNYQIKMGETLLKSKYKFLISILIILISSNVFAINVLISKDNISYKQHIKTSSLFFKKIEKVDRDCIPLTLEKLQKDKYVTTTFIKKNSVICEKNLKVYNKESVVFNFGLLEIEKNGKIIHENDKYISIKKEDGTIEKIYKNGKFR